MVHAWIAAFTWFDSLMIAFIEQSKWWVSALALCFALFISVALVATPNIEAWETLASLGLIFFVVIVLLAAPIWGRPAKLLWAPVIAGGVAIPFVALAQVFGQADIFTLLFRARFGVAGAQVAGYGMEILIAVLAVSGAIFATYALGQLLGWRRGLYVFATALLVIFNPLSRYVVQYATAGTVQSDLHLRVVSPQLTAPDIRPDIIIVYLEGLERAYGDIAQFGNIYAPITALAAGGVTFTDIAQVRGTGWSLAGFVASQCGVPVVADGLGEGYDNQQTAKFMPSLSCLGDVVAANAYNTAFVLGGVAEFGGFDQFMASHGYDRFVDRTAMERLYPAETITAAQSGWILDDQLVFDAAKTVYDDYASQDAPMLLSVETYGPHGTTAILSRNCTADGQARLDPDVVAAIACLVDHVEGFVSHITQARGDRPTLLVLASDHLNNDFAMNRMVAADARRNTVIMLGFGLDGPVVAGTTVDRPASMMDVYPTLLAAAGLADLDAQAGLGRSLFGAAPTMIEEKGVARLNAEVFPNPLLSEIIWRDSPE
jgi:hypothetical protein